MSYKAFVAYVEETKKCIGKKKLVSLRAAGGFIAQEIVRKVRAGQSTPLWKAQIGESLCKG